MKVCLFLQRNFAPVGDALAAILRDAYGIDEFCGYVQTRPVLRYLQTESSVEYTSLILDEDVHRRFRDEPLDIPYLKDLEARYGIPMLWPYLAADRILMYGQGVREYPHDTPPFTHEEMLRILQVTAKAIEEFLDREKPDAVVFSVVGAVSSLLLHAMARQRGISTHVIFPALFQNRYFISSRWDRVSLPQELGDTFGSAAPEEARAAAKAFIESFRQAPVAYLAELSPDAQSVSRSKQLGFLHPGQWGRSLDALGREWYRYWNDPHRDDYTVIPPSHYLLDRVKRKLRNVRGMADLYDTPIAGEPYAFFPLQVEPEIALLVSAPYAIDQIHIATYVARSLPVGWKLYIKEHPQMAEYRPRSFYERLKKIPNVRLINPATKSFGLTKNCNLITTITGSIGFEASIFGKSVITFGEHFINDLSFVKHCTCIAELPSLVQAHINSFVHDEDELLHFLSKIIENSAVLDLNNLWYRPHTNTDRLTRVRPLANLLAHRLRPTKNGPNTE